MQSPMFWILAAVLAVAYAGYGVPQQVQPPVYQPPSIGYPGGGYPWHYPGHRRHRHDRSWSSEDSDERRNRKDCRDCRKLSVLKSDKLKEMETSKPKIDYFTHKGCRRALITCPADGARWHMLINDDDLSSIVSGTHIQRLVKCNRKGKFESIILNGDEKITFTKVVCVKEPTSEGKPEAAKQVAVEKTATEQPEPEVKPENEDEPEVAEEVLAYSAENTSEEE